MIGSQDYISREEMWAMMKIGLPVGLVLVGAFAMLCFCINDIDLILRATTPFLSEGAPDYWNSTTLIEHFFTMPGDAQQYFILDSVELLLCVALIAATIRMLSNGDGRRPGSKV